MPGVIGSLLAHKLRRGHVVFGGLRFAARTALCASVLLSLPSRGSAQVGANDVVLTPPRLVFAKEPAMPPEGAELETAVEVVVEASVSTTGTVESAHAVGSERGRESPFERAAVDAVVSYRFTPATRGTTPVRAKVRVLVEFKPPPRPRTKDAPRGPAVESVPTQTGEARPERTRVQVPEEVTVTGERYETQSATELRLGKTEVRLLPGAFGDPFRAVEILPGVIPTLSGLPFFYVRGAPPSAVGYFVDEVRVPYLFHFGIGPGVIQPALVQDVTLHPAAFPARFGRYTGGVIAGETKGPSSKITGEGLVRLYDAGAFVETPLANGRAYVAVGGRYSYTGLLISLLAPNATISYRDYNARFVYDLTERLRFTAFTFGAYDYASDTQNGRERVSFASEFHRLDLRLDHDGGSKSHSRIAATLGLDRTRIEASRFARNHMLGLRGRHREVLSTQAELEVGGDLVVDLYAGDIPSPYAVSARDYEDARTLYAPRTDTSSGAWASLLWRPTKMVEVVATARADVFSSAGSVALGPSPRLAAKLRVHERADLVFAMGVAPQPPAFAIPLPAVGYRGLPGGLSYGYQKSGGVEVKLPLAFTGRVVGFHHSYFNLRDLLQQRSGDFDLSSTEGNNGAGQAYGLEAFLQRKLTQRVSATLSYTLSRSELGSTLGRPATLSLFDRTHVFQAASAVDLGRGWFTSARTVFYSGWPQAADAGTGKPAQRLPSFFRLDARVEKRWSWGDGGHISLLFEGLNVTAAKETVSQSCEANGQCRAETFGPVVLPSIGVEGAR